MLKNENNGIEFNWTPAHLLQIELSDPDKFLLIKETLTRCGVASKRDNVLYQSCHLLHKRGMYYVAHFKEMFLLDGRPSNITEEDIGRRNTIAGLLEQWGLCVVIKTPVYESLRAHVSNIKIISHREKQEWQLSPKYAMRSDRTSK